VAVPGAIDANFAVARDVSLAAAVALALALERWRPHQRMRPAWGTNLGLWIIGVVATSVVCGACGFGVAAWAADRRLGLLAWTEARPAMATATSVFALDAVSYLWHRANHRLPILWRFHQVHHADVAYHVGTALRFHPGELFLALPIRLVAIVALGVPPIGVLVFEVVFGFANLLEHGNFDLPRRTDTMVQRVLVTPSLHRAHHAREWRDLDTNFGTVFSLWDRFGRTFRPSDASEQVETGLPNRSASRAFSLGESLLLPLVRGTGTGQRRGAESL
jgi:sterol desaturase/sphingolipid hydroxylase (fatty acid hydroxylase superfamily)